MAEYLSLLIFTLLIGLCTGTFIVYGLWQFSGIAGKEAVEKTPRLVMPILVVCLGVAMLMSATHLGKPFRFINAFRNPGSMIAQEGIWSIAFGIILLVTAILALKNKRIPGLLYALGSLAACGLLLVSSLAYVKTYGFPAWNHGVTVVYYFASAALLGSGAVYFLSARQGEAHRGKIMAAVLLIAVFIQFIATLAFKIHLQFGIMSVSLPSTVGLDIARWGIGLLAPAVIAYLAWKGKINSKRVAWSFMLCIAVGEVLSRWIFFMQGVHL